MLGYGRRKADFLNLLPLFVLLLFATGASAASAVVGIDLGTEYIKAAVAKPGRPIEIVLTKDSKRKEGAALAFKPSRSQANDPDAFPERLYGGDALALSARYPSDVYLNLKTVLGLPHDSQGVKDYLARYPGLRDEAIARSSEVGVGSTLGFKSQSVSKEGTFMVEELLAMQLKNIKANAEAAVGKGNYVSDVVITHPAYYSPEEKRAIELAAELAGLRVLGLISDGLAVGLNYATHRTFDSISTGAKPEYHVVYDMGAGSTTATVLRFQGRTIKGVGKKNQTIQEVHVLGVGSDKTLGGDSLNDLVVQDMIKKFLDTPRMKPYNVPSIEVRKHGKTMARLWKDAEKVRQVLSANSIAHTTLEGLFYEDVTFKYSLTRDDFEILAKDHAARIAGPLTEALLMADIRLADVDSIILHGGLVRTPFIQKQIEDAAGGTSKIKTNVNADEAAVMGAAFRAASISPAYRVKDIRGIDVSGTAYTVSWTVDDKVKEQKIFVPTSQIGVEKQLSVKAQEDTTVTFKIDALEQPQEILSVELTNLTKSIKDLKEKYGCSSANISTVFNLRLNAVNGIPELASGSVSCKGSKAKEGGVIDNVKGLFGLGKKDQEPLKDDKESNDDPQASTPLPVEDATSSGTVVSPSAADSTVASGSSSSTSTKGSPTPTTVTIPLGSKVIIKGLNQPPSKELKTIRKRLTQFDTSDQNSILRAEALNVLEAYTYRARDYVDDESFITFSTTKARKELGDLLSVVSEWLYGDGVDAKLEEYTAKLKSLQTIVDPVLKRKQEAGKRDSAIESVRSSLTSAKSMIDMIKESIEKAAKDASSTTSSVISSASEKASSVAESATEGGDLDEDPYATPSSSAAAGDSAEALPKMFEYSEEDLTSVTKAYETLEKWLEEKLALQKKLTPQDDPAVLVADLESRASQLTKTVTNMIMKQMKFQTPPKSKKSKSSKSSKPTKSTKNKNSSSSTTRTAETATDTASIKDEL